MVSSGAAVTGAVLLCLFLFICALALIRTSFPETPADVEIPAGLKMRSHVEQFLAELPWSCAAAEHATLHAHVGRRNHVHSDFLSVDGWALCADFYLEGQRLQPMPHFVHGALPVLFVETQRVDALAPELLRLSAPYVLVTSDHLDTLSGCPSGAPGEAHPLLESDALVAWWGIFPGVVHPKFHPLPLGPKWEEQHVGFFTEDTSARCELFSRVLLPEAERPRTRLLHAKFNIGTTADPKVPQHQGDRVRAAEAAAALGAEEDDIDAQVSAQKFLLDTASAHFAACPPGNGPDTHRLWEALYLRTIPIVRRYPPLSPILDSLPVLQLDDWREMTAEYLRARLAPLQQAMARWNGAELSRTYWMSKIRLGGSGPLAGADRT